MRILLINDVAHYRDGGGNRVVVDTLQWLHAAGHEVGVACYQAPEKLTDGIKCFVVQSRGTGDSNQELTLPSIVDQFKPDVIQTHTRRDPEQQLNIARRNAFSVFLHDQTWFCSGGDRMGHDYAPCHRPHSLACLPLHYVKGCGGKSPVGNLARWRAVTGLQSLMRLQHVRLQVASAFMRSGLLENGFADHAIDHIPLYGGIADKAINHNAQVQESGCILAPARLFHSKGVHVLLNAMAELKDLQWRLVVPGEGPEKAALIRQASQLGIESKVQYLGEIPPHEMDLWYRRCQFVIFPVLRAEPFGLVGVEALAHGRPIVAFEGGAVREWLWPNETGILVKEHSSAAMAAAIRSLLTDPELCRRMGNAARLRHSAFTPAAYMERLIEGFHRAIESALVGGIGS